MRGVEQSSTTLNRRSRKEKNSERGACLSLIHIYLQKDREKRQPEQEPRGADIIAGRNAVSEALRAGRTIDSLYIQRGERSGALSLIHI